MRTALILLCLLAAGSIFGSLFPQRPVSPPRVEQYLADNPRIGPLLDRLGMFDVFGSPWYTAIYLALLTALIACIAPRALAHLRVLRARPPRAGGRLERYRTTATLRTSAGPEAAAAVVGRVLAGRRYRVAAYGGRELAAEKGYLREAGSLLFHLSVLVLLLGLGVGKGDGYRGQMVLIEGEQKANTRLNYDSFQPGRFFSAAKLAPFSLTLEDFTSSFHPDGVPAEYASRLRAVGAHGDVQRQKVAVNHPLTVDGVRVFQSDYGYAPVLKVTGPAGAALYDGPVQLLRDPASEISSGALKLPSPRPQLGLELTFFTDLHTPNNGSGPGFGLVNRPQLANPVLVVWPWRGDLRASQAASVFTLDTSRMDRVGERPLVLRPGQQATLPGGLTLSLPEVRQYTVLTLARDPGVPLVAAGAALLLAGLLPSLYVRKRRVWARVTGDGDGAGVQLAGLALQGKPAFSAEFADLAERVRAVLPSPPEAPGPTLESAAGADRPRITTPGDA